MDKVCTPKFRINQLYNLQCMYVYDLKQIVPSEGNDAVLWTKGLLKVLKEA